MMMISSPDWPRGRALITETKAAGLGVCCCGTGDTFFSSKKLKTVTQSGTKAAGLEAADCIYAFKS